MTDWSVVGEILGETNLDNVGDTIEDSMEEASDSLQDAAGSAEITEEASENLTKSLLSLSGAAESAEGDLDEVGDEMQEIVGEAQGANASVATLAGTLEAIDAQDVDIDVDTDRGEQLIQALSGRAGLDETGEMAARQGLRDAMGDDGTLADVIRNIDRMSGETAETADVLGALDDVIATNMGSIEDLDDEYRQMRQNTEGVNDAMRRLPAGLTESLTFRRDVADRLDLSDDRFGRGGVVSGLGNLAEEDRTISDLARRLSDMDVVASDFEDAMRAIEKSFPQGESGVDETSGLPVPREGAFDPDWVQEQFREGIRTAAGDSEPFFDGESLSERFDSGDLTSVRTAILEREDREALAELGEIPWQQVSRGIPDDEIQISPEAADDLDLDVGRRGGVGAPGVGSAMGSMFGTAGAAQTAENRVGALVSELRNLQAAAVGSNTTLGFVIASLATYAGSANRAEDATEELDDEVEDLARSLAALAPALKTVSANLGPFNIGLTNLVVTLPTLLATVGPLIAVLGGLVGVVVALAGALAGLLAVGAIGFLEDMENSFADITNTMEAAQALFQGLQKAVVEALAPLEDVEIGGLGAQGIFVTVLRDIVTLIHMFAEAAAEILNMEVVEDFLLNMRAAMLGFSDATADGMSMIEGLKQLIRGALPILEGLLLWFINVLPEAMAFFGEITNEAAPAMAEFSQALLTLATLLTEVGTGALSVILPALAFLFDIITFGIGVLVSLERAVGDVSNVLVAAGGGFLFLTLTVGKAVSALDTMFETMDLVTNTVARMNDAVEESDTVFQAFNKAVLNTESRMVRLSVGMLGVIAGFALMAIGIYLILDALGLLQPAIDLLNSTVGPLIDMVTEFHGALEGIPVVGSAITRILELIVGLLFVAAGAMVVYNSAMFAGAGAAWSYVTGISAASITTQGFTGAVWSAVASVTALQVALSAGIIGGLIAMGAGLKWIADNAGVMEAIVTGAIATIGGLFAGLVASVVAGAGIMASALIATGVGAIIVGIGVAILALIKHWDKLKNAVRNATRAIASFIDDMLGPLDNMVVRLLQAIGLLKQMQGLAPAPGMGESQEGSGLGSIFAKTAAGAGAGAVAGSVIPGAGTAGGAAIGGLAGLADATVLQKGGYVSEGGLAFLHSDEFVIPADMANGAFADADIGAGANAGGARRSSGGGMRSGAQVQVQIDNSGSGQIDERRAQRIGEVMIRQQRRQRRREDGR